MSTMIENLERLNRKERFFLIGMALGNPSFRLDPAFRQRLSDTFGVAVPEDAFVAIDYHLNWIFAAAYLAFKKPVLDMVYENDGQVIDGTQEDIDLLVGFEDVSGVVHLIMLEAKGVTPFSNRQFEHKLARFKSMFGRNCENFPNVKPHFGLVSPRQSKGLRYAQCPPWLQGPDGIPWLEMPIPKGRITLLGCDQHGRSNKERQFWTVRPA